MGDMYAGAVLLLIRLHKKAATPHEGHAIQSTHVSKERVPNRTYREALQRQQRAAAGRHRSAAHVGVELLDDHTLLTHGECRLHSKQCKKERNTSFGLREWVRSRGFLWKVGVARSAERFCQTAIGRPRIS